MAAKLLLFILLAVLFNALMVLSYPLRYPDIVQRNTNKPAASMPRNVPVVSKYLLPVDKTYLDAPDTSTHPQFDKKMLMPGVYAIQPQVTKRENSHVSSNDAPSQPLLK
ncbi:hypothetical protein BX070DRAFT_237256 [Coemansia spiralis]|nr:hypothetical protein BX070DRAFT_237256 [Coemansia spiralis]